MRRKDVVSPSSDDARWNGVTFLLVAGIFLAHNYDVLRLRDSWPLFIVMGGLSVLFNSARCQRRGNPS